MGKQIFTGANPAGKKEPNSDDITYSKRKDKTLFPLPFPLELIHSPSEEEAKTATYQSSYPKQYENYNSNYIEQYKMFVDTTIQTDNMRFQMNSIYISINSLWITLTTILCKTNQFLFAFLSFLGIAISLSWFIQLKAYRTINEEKYLIIHDIEANLPIAPFDKWYKSISKKKRLHSLTKIESFLPCFFALSNLGLCIVSFFSFPLV